MHYSALVRLYIISQPKTAINKLIAIYNSMLYSKAEKIPFDRIKQMVSNQDRVLIDTPRLSLSYTIQIAASNPQKIEIEAMPNDIQFRLSVSGAIIWHRNPNSKLIAIEKSNFTLSIFIFT